MPIWFQLIVDKLEITIGISSASAYGTALTNLYVMKKHQSELVPEGRIVVIKDNDHYTTRLDYYPFYKSTKNHRRIAAITMGAPQLFGKKAKHRYFKLTLSPSQFRQEEFAKFRSGLAKFFPTLSYETLFSFGRVSLVEFAVDCLTISPHSFLPYRKFLQKSEICKTPLDAVKKGTIYLGSKSSKRFFRIYDKKRELKQTGKPMQVEQLHQTRIEAVLAPPKLLSGKIPSPAELNQLPNPFSTLQIADLELAKAQSSDLDWQAFLSESMEDGVPYALSKRTQAIRRAYKKRLVAVPVAWWNPDVRWEAFPKALLSVCPIA